MDHIRVVSMKKVPLFDIPAKAQCLPIKYALTGLVSFGYEENYINILRDKGCPTDAT